MLTQDATYLCNTLDLKVVPQPSYPFFHLKMEDVWVWDKNRPTRMIPRAEVYTSSDVTVEELRGEGEEPHAHRRGARRAARRAALGDDDEPSVAFARLGSRMLLAVDVGNTQTVFGLSTAASSRALARRDRARRTGDELGVLLGGLLDLERSTGSASPRRCPLLVRECEEFAERWAHAPLLVVGPGVEDRDPDPLRRPARGRARPDRRTRSRRRSATARP